jgi:hypothetical protein
MSPISRRLSLALFTVTAGLLASACGGGDASPPPTPLSTSGYVVDGYLRGAAVLCDSDGNGLVTAGETSVATTSAGLYVFPAGCASGMVATGGSSIDTGLPFSGTLRAPALAKVITPLTTLMIDGLSMQQLNAALALPAVTDLAQTDPAATDGAGAMLDPVLMKKTLAVQQLLQKASEVLSSLSASPDPAALPAIYSEVAAAFADMLKGGGQLIVGDTVVDAAMVGNLVKAATQRVANSTTLPVAIRSGAASVNADALAGVTAGGLKVQAEAILNSGGAADITNVTRAQQSDTQIVTYVVTNRAALAGNPTAEAVNAMASTLTQQVVASQGSGGDGGNGGGGVTPPVPGDGSTLLLSFDEAAPAFTDMGAYGGALPSVENAPAGGSGMALKILKPVSPDTWGGVFFGVARIPFAADRKTLTARVYATRAAAVILLKVEVPGGTSVEVAGAPTGAANTWSTVTWNLAAVDAALSYTSVAITPDVDRVTDGQAYFIDTLTLAAAGTSTPPPIASGSLLLSFDENTPAFTDMGAYGGALPSVENAPAGGSGMALKILKPVAPDTWGGVFFGVARIPFAADRTRITARVYSTRAGAVINFKVEAGAASAEVASSPTGAANTWSTVTWNLAAVDPAQSYTVVAITPDAETVTSGQSYYIDDITLAAAVVLPPTPPANAAAVLLSFDETTPAFTDMGAYGGALPTVENAPAGGSGMALKILKPVAPDTWGGVFFGVARIPFAADRKTLTARVYSTRADAVIRFKVEVPGGSAVEVASSPTGPANTWSTVSWNFAGVDATRNYSVIAITPDLETVTTGQAYWIDDISIAAAGTNAVQPVTIATLDEAGAALVGFEGCWDSTVVADPAGGTNKVGKVVKPGSGVPFYCGSTLVTVANGGFTPIPFTDSAKTLTVRVYSPDANIPVRLKVEDIADSTKSVEAETSTSAVGWQTMTFNFAAPAAGALDLTTQYTKVAIFFNFGVVGTGKTYYFDDVTLVTGTGTDTVLVTFDEKNYNNTQSQPSVLSGFGGAEDSTLVGPADVGVPPDGAKTGKWAKVVKNAGETWAGTSVQRKPNDAVPTIPFATGATKMSVRVYSAYPGVRVHLKVEQSGRPDVNSEVDACTTLTNAWETLTFEFGPAGQHFVPSGPCPGGYQTDPNQPGYQPTAQLDVSKTYNKVNIFFDYGLGLAGYDSMPAERTYYFDEVKFIGP